MMPRPVLGHATNGLVVGTPCLPTLGVCGTPWLPIVGVCLGPAPKLAAAAAHDAITTSRHLLGQHGASEGAGERAEGGSGQARITHSTRSNARPPHPFWRSYAHGVHVHSKHPHGPHMYNAPRSAGKGPQAFPPARTNVCVREACAHGKKTGGACCRTRHALVCKSRGAQAQEP